MDLIATYCMVVGSGIVLEAGMWINLFAKARRSARSGSSRGTARALVLRAAIDLSAAASTLIVAFAADTVTVHLGLVNVLAATFVFFAVTVGGFRIAKRFFRETYEGERVGLPKKR